MANWYVKPSTSHSAFRPGTSEALAFGTWAEITWASINAGDTLFLCGNFNFTTTQSIGAHNGTSNNPVIISGAGPIPGSINITVAGQTFTPRSNTTVQNIDFTYASRCILTTGSLTYFTLESCSFNGGTNAAFTLSSSTGHNHTDIRVNNCTFIGGNDNSALGTGAAISWFASTASAVTTCTRITITNNKFSSVNPEGTSRGVLSFRSEEDVDATSIIVDLIIEDNLFENNRGYTVEAVDGHSFGAASPQFGLWRGFRFNRNRVTNQTVDAGRVLGGGCAAFGFAESTSTGFGANHISDNIMTNLEGQCGGINVGYGAYIIQRNRISNVGTYSIDGCGILLDDGIRRTIVSQNYVYNCPGYPTATNSGAGIMFLNTSSTLVFGNFIDKCRYGLYMGSPLPSSYTLSFNNTFLRCQQAGIIMGSVADRTSTQAFNNLFTGVGEGTNYSVQITSGTSWSNENNNCFYNFATSPLNHTFGANTITTNPELLTTIIFKDTSPLKGAGRFVLNATDYLNKPLANRPSIGAYEYKGIRGIR